MRTADCGLRAAGYGGPYIDERRTTYDERLSERRPLV